jgi:tetratricopeptide (TPR) repeat protein
MSIFSLFKPDKQEEEPQTPLLTPSAIHISPLLSPSITASFESLPETQTVLDIIDGSWSNNNPRGEANALINQVEDNIKRARDIFQALPDLHSATYLLEASLLSHVGQFEKATVALTRYQHSSIKYNPATLQFLKAKLLFHSGKFTHALAEYEDLLEYMEKEVERQMQQQSNSEEALPVVDGAAALTGVGLAKLMIHHTSNDSDSSEESEIIESIKIATEMLLESRKDAFTSVKHYDLALDLGLAAVISLTNFGVVQQLVAKKKESSIKRWKQGLEVLDQILHDSVKSATVIPNHKYQCMQSLRARLHGNIACVLLGLDGNLKDHNAIAEIDEATLKEASDMAKKSLEIYDEILNGPKVSSSDGATMESEADEDDLREALKDGSDLDEENDSDTAGAKDLTLSPLWTQYHRAESARALGLVAMCYYHAGAAVTSEGLLQSAIDASSSCPFGQCLKSSTDGIATKGVSLSSPNLALIARDVRFEYALLCDKWDKRKSDAVKYRADAAMIEKAGALKGFESETSVSGLISSLWLFSPMDFR